MLIKECNNWKTKWKETISSNYYTCHFERITHSFASVSPICKVNIMILHSLLAPILKLRKHICNVEYRIVRNFLRGLRRERFYLDVCITLNIRVYSVPTYCNDLSSSNLYLFVLQHLKLPYWIRFSEKKNYDVWDIYLGGEPKEEARAPWAHAAGHSLCKEGRDREALLWKSCILQLNCKKHSSRTMGSLWARVFPWRSPRLSGTFPI